VVATFALVPIQARTHERRLRLRIRNRRALGLVGESVEARELTAATFRDERTELGFVIREVAEGRTCGPFLPHEHERRHGQEQE
jgi:hypothetical protein